MNFLFAHDGRTFRKHTECALASAGDASMPIGAGERARVVIDEPEHHAEEPVSLEPSGDFE